MTSIRPHPCLGLNLLQRFVGAPRKAVGIGCLFAYPNRSARFGARDTRRPCDESVLPPQGLDSQACARSGTGIEVGFRSVAGAQRSTFRERSIFPSLRGSRLRGYVCSVGADPAGLVPASGLARFGGPRSRARQLEAPARRGGDRARNVACAHPFCGHACVRQLQRAGRARLAGEAGPAPPPPPEAERALYRRWPKAAANSQNQPSSSRLPPIGTIGPAAMPTRARA